MARLSGKALAAIALTLIVASPLIVGYAMASTTEEKEVWQSGEVMSLNGAILNSMEPIYSQYDGSMNNAEFYLVDKKSSALSLTAPRYASVSSTYSSLPEYTTGASDVLSYNDAKLTGVTMPTIESWGYTSDDFAGTVSAQTETQTLGGYALDVVISDIYHDAGAAAHLGKGNCYRITVSGAGVQMSVFSVNISGTASETVTLKDGDLILAYPHGYRISGSVWQWFYTVTVGGKTWDADGLAYVIHVPATSSLSIVKMRPYVATATQSWTTNLPAGSTIYTSSDSTGQTVSNVIKTASATSVAFDAASSTLHVGDDTYSDVHAVVLIPSNLALNLTFHWLTSEPHAALDSAYDYALTAPYTYIAPNHDATTTGSYTTSRLVIQPTMTDGTVQTAIMGNFNASIVKSSDTTWSLYTQRLLGVIPNGAWTYIGEITGLRIAAFASYVDESGSSTASPTDYSKASVGTWQYAGLPLDKNTYVLGTGVPFSVRVVQDDGTVTYASSQSGVRWNASEATLSTGTLTGISSVSIAVGAIFSESYDKIPAYHLGPSGLYADWALGWAVPSSTSARAYWANEQVNSSVALYATIPSGSSISLAPANNWTAGNDQMLTIARSSAGTVTVAFGTETQTLGGYATIEIVVSSTGFEVYGLASVPAFGSEPVRYNHLHVDSVFGDFRLIEISASSDVHFVVHTSSVVSGSFPSTKDCILDVSALYPGKSYIMEITSVGIYGTSLTVGGQTLPVSGNSLTLPDGTSHRILHMTISSLRTDDGYVMLIDDTKIGTTQDAASVGFDGRWSLAISGYEMDSQTKSVTHWAPGVMGLSDDARHTVGLAVALCCLIGLGLYGARSGVKMLWLIMACGLGAVVLLAMM